MRALVTGGAGFIGSHLVEALLSRGAAVRVLDNFLTGKPGNLASFAGRIDLVQGDVRDPDVCRRAAEGIDVVFHLAALPSVPKSIEEPILSVSINEVGTVAMLAAAREAGVRRFVYSSSSSVYGDDPAVPKGEDLPPGPVSPYAAGKLAGEYACRAFSSVWPGFATVSLRYFNVYGPRQDPTSAYAAVIPAFATRCLAGQAPVIYGDGLQSRDFTYVADVVAANLAAAEGRVTDGSAVNIAVGSRTTLLDLLAEIQALCGTRLTPVHRPERPGDVRHSGADVSRARELLGFSARTPLAEGLKRTVAAYRQG